MQTSNYTLTADKWTAVKGKNWQSPWDTKRAYRAQQSNRHQQTPIYLHREQHPVCTNNFC